MGFYGDTSERSTNAFHPPVLLSNIKGSCPSKWIRSLTDHRSDEWDEWYIPFFLKKSLKCQIRILGNDFRAPKQSVSTKMQHLWISEIILTTQDFHRTVLSGISLPRGRTPNILFTWGASSTSQSSPVNALLLGSMQNGKFSGQGFIWKKNIASLKRLMSFARQRPWVLPRTEA